MLNILQPRSYQKPLKLSSFPNYQRFFTNVFVYILLQTTTSSGYKLLDFSIQASMASMTAARNPFSSNTFTA